MKKILAVSALLLAACGYLQGQVLRSFTPRYSNASVRGNIVYVANNFITSSGGTTNEAPPNGTSTNNGRTGVNIDIDAAPAGTSYISTGSSWKYLDNNTRPAGWETTGFNDAAWASGNAELGYGDGDEATIVSFGPDAANKYVTTYFRRTVNIANPAAHYSFRMDLECDDGFVVYVNGVEVGRNNMPAGAVAHATYASSAIEDQVTGLTIPVSAFVAGNNVIAVEVHQANAGSSDVSFNLSLAGSNDETFNSSSANLNLSSCSQILWAGLYWGATQGSSGTNTSWITGENTVKFKAPGATAYTTVTASQVDYHNSTLVPGLPHTGYRSFANITALLNSTSANGTYTVANMTSPAGLVNTSGGWCIVVVFSNPAEIPRNLTVFDGSAIIDGGSAAMDVNLSGFLTPPTGPVSCELGAIVFDGDRGSQDEFSFRQSGAGSFTNLTPNATSNTNDMWNSTITYKGANTTTRLPAHQNTHGYDADILLLPNTSNAVLGNNQTAATVRFSSPSENYFVQVLTTSISIYNPSFNLAKSSTDLNGGLLAPGDVLRYQIDYSNVGNDNSTATHIVDNIPGNTSYKPGTLVMDGIPKTDAAGDDEAEYDFVNHRVIFRIGAGANATTGGIVTNSGVGSTGVIRFDVFMPTSCAIIACSNTVSNSARINYAGQASAQILYDSSGYVAGGCFTRGPVTNTISGSCMQPGDTSIVNLCPSITVTIPAEKYSGYRFYSAIPFGPATEVNPALPINSTRTIFAFFDGLATCDDTVLIRVFVNACPDIDDDNDGIPDYVEANLLLAFIDHDSDGIPNYADANYPGFVDYNADGNNDNFDPSGDSDNDGIPNFSDGNFPGFADANGDGVNDNFDQDRDGIPNHLDLDSDNDGIPDVAESFGVDTNGDGRLDNYSDTDNDGFSQLVDANNTGVVGSGTGLGAIDTDGDGVPNFLDLDSDGDGIPDVKEVYGTDANGDGRIDGFTDLDGDGLSDTADGDVGNDGTAENTASALLPTGPDANGDARSDSFPFKNPDGDARPNPYELDSDGDGIADVTEGGYADANQDGSADGALNSHGWSVLVSGAPSAVLRNRDGTGRADAYDIDSDDDGIPDNVEGQSTPSYQLPSGSDTDGDGIDNTYDDISGFGGKGITPFNMDGDGFPDYLDLDTDGDGMIDRIEGNDLNFNRLPDDNVTLTGADTDGDGLDNRFDNNHSSPEGTSAYMGNNGSTTGDPTPGSITVVQKSWASAIDRDWRNVDHVLSIDFLSFQAINTNKQVSLKWTVVCHEALSAFTIERSADGANFTPIRSISGAARLNEVLEYTASDDISAIHVPKIYYRIKALSTSGKTRYSSTVFVSAEKQVFTIRLAPNPVKDKMQLMINTEKPLAASLRIIDMQGRTVYSRAEKLAHGSNSIAVDVSAKLSAGLYVLQLDMGDGNIHQEKFTIER
ncbi:MAG TPA: T9SS type A sorting domain-containing protein [Flavisolibacter sp.]|nr:T9SS type A sorting domain-containing protein [Flavisolibacter sp.]